MYLVVNFNNCNSVISSQKLFNFTNIYIFGIFFISRLKSNYFDTEGLSMTNLKFDPVHSSLEFSIRHLMVSKIKGTFNDYTVDVKGDLDDLSSMESVTTINVDSIDTKNPDRDNHLKTADFFNAESHQQITFRSKTITENKITGDLTIAGQTNEETFDFEQHGVSDNPLSGGQVTGFTVTGTIDREKYGMNFNQALETGGVMLGKEVKFEFHGEFTIEG